MALSLQSYRIQKIDDRTYSFTTVKGIEYICLFLSYAEYFGNYPDVAPYFFSFNLELKDKSLKPPAGVDKKIADTVVKIVGDFLTSRINAVVYVCDNSDGKEAARSRKFVSWFDFYQHPSYDITQVSNNVNIGGTFLYTCLLINRKNKRFTDMILAYLEVIKEEGK